MSALQNNIISTAISWYDRECYEKTQNRGACIDDIHEQYSQAWIEAHTNEAYCAEFVSVVLKSAFQRLGASTPLYTASAVGMLSDAKAEGIKVDRTVNTGAVFYKKSSAAGSSGHVGIIVENIDGNRFNTVEGNATDPRTGREGVVSIQRSVSGDNSLVVIHVENVLGTSGAQFAGSSKPMMVILLAVAAGVIYQNRKELFS